jgi:Uma2 family endonuclease
MATTPPGRAEGRDPPQRFVLRNVHWNLYDALFREIGDRPIRLTFDQGDLEMASLPPQQSFCSRLVDKLVKTLAEVASTPLKTNKRLIFKRRELERVLEPDRYYYIYHDLPVRDMRELNSAYDLPPDLVVEIDLAGSTLDRLGIYAAYRVPEVWRFDGRELRVHGLQEDQQYKVLEHSLWFPFPPLTEALRFLHRCETMSENDVVPSLHAWIRDEMAKLQPRPSVEGLDLS